MFSVDIYQKQTPIYRKDFYSELNEILKKENMKMTLKNEIFHLKFFQRVFFWFRELSSLNKIIVFPFSIRKIDIFILIFIRIIFFVRRTKVKAKVIWWGIGHMPNEKFVVKTIRSRFMHYVDKVILYTEKEAYLYSILNPRLRYVHSFENCINTIDFGDYEQLGVIADEIIVGFVGTMHARSNASLLPEIIKEVNRKCEINLSFELVGDGEFYEIIAETLSSEPNVRMVGRVENDLQLAKIMDRWTIGLYPGAAGLSAYTYLRSGVPYLSVASPFIQSPEHNALPDDLKLTFNEVSPDVIAKRLMRYLANRKNLKRISDDMVKASWYYSPNRAATRFAKVLVDFE